MYVNRLELALSNFKIEHYVPVPTCSRYHKIRNNISFTFKGNINICVFFLCCVGVIFILTHFEVHIFPPMPQESFTKSSEGHLGCSAVLWCIHLHMQDRNNASVWAVCRSPAVPIRSQPEVEMTNTIRQQIHHPVCSDSNCPGSMSQSPC